MRCLIHFLWHVKCVLQIYLVAFFVALLGNVTAEQERESVQTIDHPRKILFFYESSI